MGENISGKLWSMERSGNLGQVHNGILTAGKMSTSSVPATYALWQQNISHILTFSKVKFNLSTASVIIFRSGPNSIVVWNVLCFSRLSSKSCSRQSFEHWNDDDKWPQNGRRKARGRRWVFFSSLQNEDEQSSSSSRGRLIRGKRRSSG